MFLWFSIQLVLRSFELYALLAFELLISTLVVLMKKMLSLESYQSETESWNATVSWIILKRNHWEFRACIRAVSFFDIDTISDNAQDFVENSWHHWIVWSLNQNMTDSNWRDRYLEKNWKNRNSKAVKISRTSQRSEKNVEWLDKWMWFCNILEERRWFQYWILVEVLNEDMRDLKNWSEIWILNVINFITNVEESRLICWINWCNSWRLSSKANSSNTDRWWTILKILLKCWLIFELDYWDYH